VDELPALILGKGLGHRTGKPAGGHPRGKRGGILEKVKVRAVPFAVFRDAIERLVLTHPAAQEDLEHVRYAQLFRYDAGEAAIGPHAEGARTALAEQTRADSGAKAQDGAGEPLQHAAAIHRGTSARLVAFPCEKTSVDRIANAVDYWQVPATHARMAQSMSLMHGWPLPAGTVQWAFLQRSPPPQSASLMQSPPVSASAAGKHRELTQTSPMVQWMSVMQKGAAPAASANVHDEPLQGCPMPQAPSFAQGRALSVAPLHREFAHVCPVGQSPFEAQDVMAERSDPMEMSGPMQANENSPAKQQWNLMRELIVTGMTPGRLAASNGDSSPCVRSHRNCLSASTIRRSCMACVNDRRVVTADARPRIVLPEYLPLRCAAADREP